MDSWTQDAFVEETPEVCFVDGFDTLFDKDENVEAEL